MVVSGDLALKGASDAGSGTNAAKPDAQVGPQPGDSAASAEPSSFAPLAALCAIARFHQVAADPATLAHQLGLSASDAVTSSDLLRAAKHLGLQAKLSRTSTDRLGLTPLPALALMHSDTRPRSHWPRRTC